MLPRPFQKTSPVHFIIRTVSKGRDTSGTLDFTARKHYKGLFTSTKSKLHRWPIQYAVHDITQIKMPDLAITDASDQGVILAGQPLAVDKQSAKLLGLDIEDVPHLELVNDSEVEEQELSP